jgi:UDP-N-acetylmuramate dehydrogenase
LEERLASLPHPGLSDVRDAVIAIRADKGVLIRSGYESWKSAGSFFKNPIVTGDRFEEVRSALGEKSGSKGWAWPLPDGGVKISAAYLIQSAGFNRGHREGKVGLSPYHTLIVVNFGGASAREIVKYAATISNRVMELFGVQLQPEARLIGFRGDGSR